MPTFADEEFSHRLVENFMSMFINPEVERRQVSGELPKPLELRAAQVILFPDERSPVVRVNSEVRAIAKITYVEGTVKAVGDAIYAHDIEAIESVELGPDDDPDCGHIFLFRFGKGTWLSFDFRLNRKFATSHIVRAEEFYSNAKRSLEQGEMGPFVDNLFSAVELAAKAILFVMFDFPPSVAVKATHKRIQERYNRFANLGNILPEHKKTLNRLSGLRGSARYLRGTLSISREEGVKLVNHVWDVIEDAKLRVA